MEDGYPCGLTRTEEAHRPNVHQRHLIQVQPCPGSVALSWCLQCLQTRCSQVADLPEYRAVSIRMPAILQVIDTVSFLASTLAASVNGKS